jgi:3-phytase
MRLVGFVAAIAMLSGCAGAPLHSHVVGVATPAAQVDAEMGPGDMDDPAFWIAPEGSRGPRGLIIAAVKQGGLRVYGLDAKTVQSIAPSRNAAGKPGNRFNNVDVQYDFALGGRRVDIAVASDRIRDRLTVWRIDPSGAVPLTEITAPDMPRLFPNRPDPADPQAKSVANPDDGKHTAYGLGLYRDRRNDRFYALVTQNSEAVVAKWELVATVQGTVSARFVKEWRFPYVYKGQDLTHRAEGDPASSFSPQFEGIVVDQQTGIAYAGQEDVGIWRIDLRGGRDVADSAPFVETRAFDPASPIARDVEGLTIYYGDGESGYLLASSQGNAHGKHPAPIPGLDDTFAVFERAGANAYIGSFSIGANRSRGIDGVQECDGADVTSVALPGYPAGLFVAQDGYNGDKFDGSGGTNLKFVPWDSIAAAFPRPLQSRSRYDPRRP